jgi:hypothetical protein
VALPVAPTSVTVYDVIKDLGFPIAVTLILLFQIGPKLDSVVTADAALQSQVADLVEVCRAQP